jgi:phage terminase large subunit GpA-like protein
MQNEPLLSDLGNVVEMTKDEVATRLSGRPRLIVPHGDTRVTAFIDVQGIGLLFYLVLATRDDFTAHCIDYGTWPDQHRRYFTKSSAPSLLPNGDKGLHSGLIELGCDLLTTDYKGESGGSFMIDLLLVDSGHQAELIYEFVRQMRARGFGNRILPSKGEGPGANERKGFTEGPRTDPRERRGFEWILPPPKEARGVKLLRYNTNAWKSFLWERIAVEDGAKGSLTFFGSDPAIHRMLFDHLFAEYRDRMKSERSGREIDVWHERGNQDNDYLDCLVGAAVAASVQGAILQDVQASRPAAKVVDYAELYRQAQEAKR